jgi:predicted aconitase with swiveling domain
MAESTARREGWRAHGRALHDGSGDGTALVLGEPLSFWGGLDPATGRIIDRRHPQLGESVTGRVLVMTAGRGSSSSSTVLAEALRAGTGPAAILLCELDEIIVLGALVAEILDGRSVPVVLLDGPAYGRLRSGDQLRVEPSGWVAKYGRKRSDPSEEGPPHCPGRSGNRSHRAPATPQGHLSRRLHRLP